jgi:hypothetical protein
VKRLWWIPYSLLVAVSLILSLVEWAAEEMGLALCRAGWWIEDRMRGR